MRGLWIFFVIKYFYWHIVCTFLYFIFSEAAILGGRPKRVSEEDVSARFFKPQNWFIDFVSCTLLSLE